MKMRKRFLGIMMATVLTLGTITTAFAAGSPTKDVTVSEEAAGKYEVVPELEKSEVFTTLKETAPEVADLIEKVNKGEVAVADFRTELDKALANVTDETAKAAIEKVIEVMAAKDFVTGFVEVRALEEAELNENGKYEIAIAVPGLADGLEGVVILYYNVELGTWEVFDPKEVDTENGTVTFEFEDENILIAVAADEDSFEE